MFALRPSPEQDESLESYIVRLADLNHFRVKKLFPHFAQLLAKESDLLAGAIPNQLDKFNLYHANTSSCRRYQALHALSKMCCKDPLPILELAVYRSDKHLLSRLSFLYWKGQELPRVFFRRDCIPVCPKCLKESAYIPQQWHFEVVRACPKHKCHLIDKCPACETALNYMHTGSILTCACGFNLSGANTKPATKELIQLADTVCTDDPLPCDAPSLEEVLWFLLWVKDKTATEQTWQDGDLEECMRFFQDWPHSFENHLHKLSDDGIEYSIRPLNETHFNEIFGNLLNMSRWLHNKEIKKNRIWKAIFVFLDPIAFESDHRHTSLADTLLNSFEAAAILGTTLEQVARIYDEGLLRSPIELKKNNPFKPYSSLFRLRDVFTLWASRFQTSQTNRSLYLSRW